MRGEKGGKDTSHNRGDSCDLDGRLTGISVVNGNNLQQSLTYGYDTNDLISALTNGTDTGNSHRYEYDPLARLVKDTLGGNVDGSVDRFDAVGNRTGRGSSAGGYTPSSYYSISSTTNRVSDQSGNASNEFSYTPSGNRQAAYGWQGNRTYAYDGFDRLKSVTVNGAITSYTINAMDQRVGKVNASGGQRFVYAGQNQLLAHTTSATSGWRNYLWLGDRLVAIVGADNTLSYVHSDHLGRPQVATNAAQQPVWKAVNTSYHRSVTQDSIGGILVGFPGQLWDEDTSTWYNGFRDYDPFLGRYLQSDPVGLAGGLNTYAYVDANPVMRADPSGLAVCLESTNNPTVPFGLHQRVAVYDSSGRLVHGQSFGTNNPNAGSSTSERGSSGSGDADTYTGEVYNNTSDTTRDKKECTASTDKQNAKIVLPILQSELGQQGPYSATGIGGMSCRSYSNDAYNRIKQVLRSAGGG